MSLFASKTYWQAKADGEYDYQSLVVENVLKTKNGNAQIITASFEGILNIYRVKTNEFKPDDLILRQDLELPVLGIATGSFTSPSASELAVLHPKSLSVYSFVRAEGGISIRSLYTVELDRKNAVMLPATLGGADHHLIIVQSIDGQLTVLDRDRISFQAELGPSYLMPGPMAYVEQLDLLLLASSEYDLEAVSFGSLAASSTQRRWRVCLGARVHDLITGNVLGEAENEIAVIMPRGIVWLDAKTGQMLTERRSLQPLLACTRLPIPGGVLLANGGPSLSVLKHGRVRWTSRIPVEVCAVRVGQIAGVSGMVVALADDGEIYALYLGTDPRPPSTLVQNAAKTADSNVLRDKLIKEVTALRHLAATDCLDFVAWPSSVSATGNSSSAKIQVRIQAKANIQGVQLEIALPAGLSCSSPLPVRIGDLEASEEREFDLTLATVPKTFIPVLKVSVAISCTFADAPAVLTRDLTLPVTLAHSVVTGDIGRTTPDPDRGFHVQIELPESTASLQELLSDAILPQQVMVGLSTNPNALRLVSFAGPSSLIRVEPGLNIIDIWSIHVDSLGPAIDFILELPSCKSVKSITSPASIVQGIVALATKLHTASNKLVTSQNEAKKILETLAPLQKSLLQAIRAPKAKPRPTLARALDRLLLSAHTASQEATKAEERVQFLRVRLAGALCAFCRLLELQGGPSLADLLVEGLHDVSSLVMAVRGVMGESGGDGPGELESALTRLLASVSEGHELNLA